MADLNRTDRLPPVSIRGIYLSKAGALAVVLIVATPLSWLPRGNVPFGPLALVIVAVALFDLGIAAWPHLVPRAALVFSIVVDIVGITACIHFGGGVQVIAAPIVYLVVIGLAGTLLSERAAVITAAGCAFAYATLIWAEHHGLLISYGWHTRPPQRQVGTVVLVSIGLFVAAWVVLYAVRQVRVVYQAAEDLRSESVKALSRDLQNPLGMIERYARMVEPATAAERRDIVQRIQRLAGQALGLVHNVLDAALLMSGRTIPLRRIAVGAMSQPTVGAAAADRAEGGWSHRAELIVARMRAELLPAPNVRAIYVVKSAAFTLLIFVGWLLKWLHDPEVPAAAATLVIGLALLPTLAIAVRRREVPMSLLALSVAADVASVTTGIHIGGGIEMISGPIAYIVVIGVAGLVLSEYAAVPAAVACVLGYAVVAWAECHGLLVHHSPNPLREPEFQLIAVTLVSTCLFLATWVVLYAVHQIRWVYRRAEEVRSDVVSALSHDLKNPLTVIQGYAELAEDCAPSELPDYVQGMRRCAQQALDLVRNVLDASAIDGEHVAQHRQPLHLDDLVRETIELYRFAADAKNIHLRLRAAPATPVIAVDGQQLTRAIGNLVSNAIKYTDRGGAVEVATAVDHDAVTVAIRDTGRGIPVAEQSRLFKKYSRTESAQGIEGSGLGLYIVRRIAEAHGGSVRVTSAVGSGSTFTLALPVTIGESQPLLVTSR